VEAFTSLLSGLNCKLSALMINRVEKIYVGFKNKIFWAVFVTYLLRQYLKLTINSLQGFEEATADTS
jgi:hypothetical protein